MNKVYGLMSVGMLITGAAAWAISGLAVTDVQTAYQIGADRYLTDFGYALYASPLKWLVMLAPLVMVFAFGAVLNRISAAGAQVYFYAYAACWSGTRPPAPAARRCRCRPTARCRTRRAAGSAGCCRPARSQPDRAAMKGSTESLRELSAGAGGRRVK